MILGSQGPRKKDNGCEGSVVFFDGQKDCITNLDETNGALDNIYRQRGGRPSFVFYSEEISGGSSRANKTSYSPTIIADSSSTGDFLPICFQLNILTQSDACHKLSIFF